MAAHYDIIDELQRIAGLGYMDLKSVQNVKHTCVAANERILRDKTTDLKTVYEVLNSCPHEFVDTNDVLGSVTRAFDRRNPRPPFRGAPATEAQIDEWIEWQQAEALATDQEFNRWVDDLFAIIPVLESLPFDMVKHEVTRVIFAIAMFDPSMVRFTHNDSVIMLGTPEELARRRLENGGYADAETKTYHHFALFIDSHKAKPLHEFMERWQAKCAADRACSRWFWRRLFELLNEFYTDAYVYETTVSSVEEDAGWYLFTPGFQNHHVPPMFVEEWGRDPYKPSCRRLEDFVPIMVKWLYRANYFAFGMFYDVKSIYDALNDVDLFYPADMSETPLNMLMNHLFVQSVAVDILAREYGLEADMTPECNLYDTVITAIYRRDAVPFFEQMFPDHTDRLAELRSTMVFVPEQDPTATCVYERALSAEELARDQAEALQHYTPELLRRVVTHYMDAIFSDNPHDVHVGL